MTFTRQPVILSLAVILLIGVAALMLLFWNVRESVKDAYALEWASIMVSQHITATGKWPSGWDELKDDYPGLVKAVGEVPPLEKWQQRIEVDFNVDVQAVNRAHDSVVFVKPRSGRQVGLSNPNPNERIRKAIEELNKTK